MANTDQKIILNSPEYRDLEKHPYFDHREVPEIMLNFWKKKDQQRLKSHQNEQEVTSIFKSLDNPEDLLSKPIPFKPTPLTKNELNQITEASVTNRLFPDELQYKILKAVLRTPITKNFYFPTLKFTESMFDTTFTHDIPLAYIRLRIAEVSNVLTAISDLGSLTNLTKLQQTKLTNRKKAVENLLKELKLHQEFLVRFQSNPDVQFFKPSSRRLDYEYRFMVSNIGLTRFGIADKKGGDEKFFNTITFGMASDHAGGYKQGLLTWIGFERSELTTIFDTFSIIHCSVESKLDSRVITVIVMD